MFDVLVYLYENYFAPQACPDTDTLSRKLQAVGFEEEEINEALSWLSGLADADTLELDPSFAQGGSFRAWSEPEAEQLGTEGIGFITFLESAGVLDPRSRELVIERSLAIEEWPVTIANIKVVVLMVLWSQCAEVDTLILEELLEDGQPRQMH